MLAIAALKVCRCRYVFALIAVAMLFPGGAKAQVIPDGTLGPESSLLLPSGVTVEGAAADLIRAGARRGENLFHSFERFSIGEGQRVYFENPAGVARVFSRVTGELGSDILGTLGSLGGADLFLLNPNGIVFGPNARLDVGGSFVASTGDRVTFADGREFSAVPQAGELLSVNVPLGVQFNASTQGDIVNAGRLEAGPGQSLTLFGRTIENSGQLTARSGGDIVLITPQSMGSTVTIDGGRVDTSVQIGDHVAGGDIYIRTHDLTVQNDGLVTANTRGVGNSGSVEISATGDVVVDGEDAFITSAVESGAESDGGGVTIAAANLSVLNGAEINTNTYGQGNSGSVEIATTGNVLVDGELSYIASDVDSGGEGNSRGIAITTTNLWVTNDALVSASIRGQGNTGRIEIVATGDVLVDGNDSYIASQVDSSGEGNSGGVGITTGNLAVLDLAEIDSNTYGVGDAGRIEIVATGNIVVDGPRSYIASQVRPGAEGNGGGLAITTHNLSVLNGGTVSSTTWGKGNAGRVEIVATGEVVLDGDDAFLGSHVNPDAEGNSGGLALTASHLVVLDGAVSASTQGRGNAGPVRIEADTITLARESSEISAESNSGDNGGGIQIVSSNRLTINGPGRIAVAANATGQAGDIEVTAESLTLSEDVTLSASTNGPGLAGNITFNLAEDLQISNGGNIFAATAGSGAGGTITINAAEAVRIGEGVQDFEPIISVESSNTGRPGNIAINTPTFVLSETARITATATETATNLDGGGSITLSANQMDLAGVVGIFAETQGQAPGGVLTLQPYQNNPNLDLTLASGSLVSASTRSSGRGGGLVIQAPEAIAISGPGRLQVETSGTGRAGDIEVTAQRLNLTGGVALSASTTGLGQAGDITLDVAERLEIDGSTVESSTGLASAGQGGSISIVTGEAILRNGGRIAVDSAGQGQGGNVALEGDRLVLADSSRITATTRSSDGGNLTFNLQDLVVLLGASEISTTAGTDGAGGDGGDITLTTPFLLSNFSANSDITANAFDGSGGNVNITASGGIFGIAPRQLRTPQSDITASSENGVSGDITIQSPEVDPSRSTAELPSAFSALDVVESCRERFAATGSSFVVTGRGGIPQGPQDPQPTVLWQDALPIEREAVEGEAVEVGEPASQQSRIAPQPIVEAQGWVKNDQGQVVLVAGTSVAVDRPLACEG